MSAKKILLSVAILVLLSSTGYADNNSAVNSISNGLGGFGSSFQSQISNLSKSLLTAARMIAVIMTAIAGCMVCFGINDGKKTFWNWILGIGLAINFGDLILSLWSVESTTSAPQVSDYKLLLKNEDDPALDILSPFMRYYISVIMQGAAVVAPYAVNLTLILAIIDGGIKSALNLISGDKVQYLVTMILKVGFFIFLIQSWIGTTSTYQLMPALSSGFESIGYTAGGANDMVKEFDRNNPDSNVDVQSNQIVTNALNFFNIFWEHAQQENILTILIGLICVVAAVIILFLTALEMFMVRIEFWTMALLTIPLLPFGVIGQLKFLADKAIGAMFNLAIKIFVIAFIATMSVNILTGLVENAKEVADSSDFIGNVSYFLQVLLYSLILYLITKKIPELVSGLLSGNPSLGGGDMKKMAMDAAKGAANAVSKVAGGAGAAVGGMKALSNAAGAMPQWGGKGSFGANALSFADAAGGKAMSMLKQGAIAGANTLKYHNPAYESYQNAISLLGNSSNGLLAKDSKGKTVADANSSGVKPSQILQNLAENKNSTTASQKIAPVANGISKALNDFFTPPKQNTDSNKVNLSKNPANRASSPISNLSSSTSEAMQSGLSSMPQTLAQADRQANSESAGSTPRATLHNLMNAKNSQSTQREQNLRRPYVPINSGQSTSSAATSARQQNMSALSSMPPSSTGTTGGISQNINSTADTSPNNTLVENPTRENGE